MGVSVVERWYPPLIPMRHIRGLHHNSNNRQRTIHQLHNRLCIKRNSSSRVILHNHNLLLLTVHQLLLKDIRNTRKLRLLWLNNNNNNNNHQITEDIPSSRNSKLGIPLHHILNRYNNSKINCANQKTIKNTITYTN